METFYINPQKVKTTEDIVRGGQIAGMLSFLMAAWALFRLLLIQMDISRLKRDDIYPENHTMKYLLFFCIFSVVMILVQWMIGEDTNKLYDIDDKGHKNRRKKIFSPPTWVNASLTAVIVMIFITWIILFFGLDIVGKIEALYPSGNSLGY
jgi:hypothetical protein